MLIRLGLARILPIFLSCVAVAGACSSSVKKAVRESEAGAPDGEESGAAGESRGGSSGIGNALEAGSSGEPSRGGTGNEAGAPSPSGAAGNDESAGAGGAPQMVTAYGCFGRTGDGLDMLDDGTPAVSLNSSAPYTAACGLAWVSDNANAYAPETPPTTIILRRRFIVDPAILQRGIFTISYKVDDGVNFILNGHEIASCMPTNDNAGFCQQACGSTSVATSNLLGDGQVNTLEIRVLNLQSIPAGGANFGYTAVSYQMCVSTPA